MTPASRTSLLLAALASTFFAAEALAQVPDHLQCFKVKDNAAKAAYVATLTPADVAFPAASGCKIQVPAKLLCVESEKSAVVPAPPGGPDGDAAGVFLCYKAKCPVSETAFPAEDQFGSHSLSVSKTRMLCAPVAPAATTTTTTTTTLPPSCGNGVVTMPEECDDADNMGGDGCSPTCTEEPGYDCTGSPSVCVGDCGDGVIVGGEECDDLNEIGGDGCSPTCTEELGYDCTGSPSLCVADCGDGLVLGSETCDDGNEGPGDGCSGTCTEEPGYDCTGSPSVCVLE